MKKISMLNLAKSLGYIKNFHLSSFWPVKSTSSLTRNKSWKIWTWTRRPEPYWKSEERPHFLWWSISLSFTNFSKVLNLSSMFLNTETTYDTLLKSGKADSCILKSWTNMYATSALHFIRTTIGIQSGPNVFEKSMLVMTLLTNLQVRK